MKEKGKEPAAGLSNQHLKKKQTSFKALVIKTRRGGVESAGAGRVFVRSEKIVHAQSGERYSSKPIRTVTLVLTSRKARKLFTRKGGKILCWSKIGRGGWGGGGGGGGGGGWGGGGWGGGGGGGGGQRIWEKNSTSSDRTTSSNFEVSKQARIPINRNRHSKKS